MRSVLYDIHGLARVKVDGLSPWTLPAFNCPYGFFRAVDAGEQPDLAVTIGPFRPDLAGCANVDHKFFLRRDYLYYREADKGLAWEAEIRGLESGRLDVRFHADPRNRLKFPWTLFPEMVLHLYVLQPLLEILLWRKGAFLFHAAALEKDGRACLIAGRGGAHKTTFSMKLLRRGWSLLGDDLVIIRGKTLLSFPTVVEQLEYLLRRRDTEALDFPGKVGLFRFLAGVKAVGLPVTPSARPAALNLVLVRKTGKPAQGREPDRASLIGSLAVNHLMEHTSYVGFKFSTAAFLDAYAYAFPEAGLDGYPAALREALRACFEDVPARVLEMPRRWDEQALDLLLT